jgi:hypothetical protein
MCDGRQQHPRRPLDFAAAVQTLEGGEREKVSPKSPNDRSIRKIQQWIDTMHPCQSFPSIHVKIGNMAAFLKSGELW